MGCGSSATGTAAPTPAQQQQQPRANLPKVPILLFYLPSTVRNEMTRLVASHLITSEATTHADKLNVRFVDVPNQRSSRKFWPREIASKAYAVALYVADIRERETMLINVRTLNWFLKHVMEDHNVAVVPICRNDLQLAEFQSLLSKKVEMLVLIESRPESVMKFVDVVSLASQNYTERKGQALLTTGAR